ncbi:DNA double-strand break repair Rad50 ATPase [uncultured archaeon]|nr:DNA double-strand break repair Rad50 ATPase [uncultured archaeon]
MFSSLKIVNWRSHKESTIFFSKGINVILGDMGSGKSSLIDALCFALYGTFPALKSKACSLDDLLNKNLNAKNFLVELTFTIEKNTFKIQRTFDGKTSKASLWVNDKFVEGTQPSRTNEALLSYLKVSYDDFVSVNYSSQGSIDYFINLTPKERRLELDEFLGLNKLNDLNEQSKVFRNKIEVIKKTLSASNPLTRFNEFQEKNNVLTKSIEGFKIQLTENELFLKKSLLEVKNIEEKLVKLVEKFKEKEANNKLLEELEKKAAFLKGRIENFKEVDLNLLKQLEEEYSRIQKDLLVQEKNLIEYEKLSANYSVNFKLFNEYSKKRSEIEERKQKIRVVTVKKELDLTKNAKASLESELSDLTEKIKVLSKDTNGICYACEKPLSQDEKHSLECKLEDRLKEVNSSLNETSKKLFLLLKNDSENELKQNELVKLVEMDNFYSEKLLALTNLKEPVKPIFSEDLKQRSLNLLEKITILRKDLTLNEQTSKDRLALESLEKELSVLREHLSKILVTQSDLDSLKKEFYEREEKRKLCESKIDSINLLLKKTIEDKTFIENQLTIEKEKVDKISKIEDSSLFLDDFGRKISLVQENYRKSALNYLNSMMNKIWKALYPHENYDSIIMKAESDSYGLYLQSGEISVPVETASGGERICVALCLRTAFALLKKSGISTLIFDEPTHNLDEKAIIHFSNSLKNNYSILIPQTIIITHDQNLREAGTGKTIMVSRFDKISKIEEI